MSIARAVVAFLCPARTQPGYRELGSAGWEPGRRTPCRGQVPEPVPHRGGTGPDAGGAPKPPEPTYDQGPPLSHFSPVFVSTPVHHPPVYIQPIYPPKNLRPQGRIGRKDAIEAQHTVSFTQSMIGVR